MPGSQIFQRILIGLSVVLLLCAAENYLVFLVSDTAWCVYVCPSAFGSDVVGDAPGFRHLFMAQQWLLSAPQALVDGSIDDPWDLVTYLITAPVVEEVFYRGPMYLTRRQSNRTIWWLIGLLLACVFALSHGRSGIGLLPIMALGAYNLWRVKTTGSLWPAISVHFLYNFFLVSVMLNQSPWVGD